MALLIFCLGLVLLVFGAELLVRGAARIATTVGISTLVVGLTVVSFGTSAPEFAVGIRSAINGQTGVALGNAIGSNILNVLLILGVASLILPLAVSKQLIRMDVPVMVGVSIVAFLFAIDGSISSVEGTVLVTGLVIYTIILIFLGRRSGSSEQIPETPETEPVKTSSANTIKDWILNVVFVFAGLALLVFGANWMVDSAIEIAEYFQLSESIIGLTIVAGGTSLPELVTTVIASLRGQRDMAVGNVVGSNIFNLLGVLGVSALCAPGDMNVPQGLLYFDFPVMLAAAIVCMPIFFTGARISRGEGAFFLGSYAAYTCYLILAANHHESLHAFRTFLVWFAVPVAVVMIAFTVLKAIRDKSKKT